MDAPTINAALVGISGRKPFRLFPPRYQMNPFAERSNNAIYAVYKGMLTRCYNHNHRDFKFYGERGIRVARRWLGKRGMINFVSDMGDRPAGKRPNGWSAYTIERLDNDKGYGPTNCVWMHYLKQYSNQRKRKSGGVKQRHPKSVN
jgi:hypothetical protein